MTIMIPNWLAILLGLAAVIWSIVGIQMFKTLKTIQQEWTQPTPRRQKQTNETDNADWWKQQ